MENKIQKALTNLFDRYRIVFWYDSKKELRDEYEALELSGVNKLEINNNEFALKYQLLRGQPEDKFLLYREGEEPVDYTNNWLLDIQLAHYVFSTDQASIWAEELGLGIEYIDLLKQHADFCKATKRREDLKALLKRNDTKARIQLKMLSVCTSSDDRLDSMLENLLEESSNGKDSKIKLIERCNLDGFLFEQMQLHFQYQSDVPSIKDFYIKLFESCYKQHTDGGGALSSEAQVFVNRWKDSRKFEKSFRKLSAECADILKIEDDLNNREYADLLEIDLFELVDLKIISGLVQDVSNKTIHSGKVERYVRQRRQRHYYDKFHDLYEAIDIAAQFISKLDNTTFSIESLTDGIKKYSQTWYLIDQLYRKYIYHLQCSGQPALMKSLTKIVEDFYSNNYLLELNNLWQTKVDEVDQWYAPSVALQRSFFSDYVKPFLDRNKKVYVIISDAMRYEIGADLVSLIRQEDRFDASIDPALSMLPSYTQLGMAALLPNKELAIKDDDSSMVLVDGQSSQGTSNRGKILASGTSQGSAVIQAKKLLDMHRDEKRALISDNSVVYVYHNLIDKTGDSRDTEERVFKASHETLDELRNIIKTLTSANASNILVTADHGFIYQNQVIDESDFSSAKSEAEEILFKNRRFVIGKKFKEDNAFKIFKSSELGLVGDVEVSIPKSINRLRVRGAGSRFVHGGASLQEIVIPIVHINKKRTGDVSKVEVDVIRTGNNVITSGQLSVMLYQVDTSSDKKKPRKLRVGIYTKDNILISDSHELVFDFSSENPRDRELKVRLMLTRGADNANNQDVHLRLEEKEPDTTHYKEYKKIVYSVKRSFTTDFDL